MASPLWNQFRVASVVGSTEASTDTEPARLAVTQRSTATMSPTAAGSLTVKVLPFNVASDSPAHSWTEPLPLLSSIGVFTTLVFKVTLACVPTS
ncbi:hypothetical protein [Paenarthrobacter sp. NPDC058040]|uniref:hypothetical protein n=1 Tax=Paenarthrobacter sp. NPDC058040 TaxID=3346309 RepID=UPI0036DA059C